VHTLRLQGGPMSSAEIAAFEALDHASDAVALRRLDEAAKVGSEHAPGFGTHRDLLLRVLGRGRH
jgi:predicted HD phosphohydrolase